MTVLSTGTLTTPSCRRRRTGTAVIFLKPRARELQDATTGSRYSPDRTVAAAGAGHEDLRRAYCRGRDQK